MAFTPRIEINGAIDTAQSVLSNINKIAASTQTYVTWDPSLGKFTTVLNRAGSSVYTFDDSNIIGSITISGTGIDGVYNSARIGFTSKDQRGKKDERVIIIPQEDRFAQELDNQLSMDFDLITDPVQAELLGAIELKQTRVDMAIEFATDYRAIGLRAGDIVGVNNELYFDRSSANPKLFRIISIEEIDGEDGGILLSITAIEYDSNVYSTSGLSREERILESGITPVAENICVIQKENAAISNKVGSSLSTEEGINNLTQNVEIAPGYNASLTLFQTESVGFSVADTTTIFGGGQDGQGDGWIFWDAYRPIKNQLITFEGPQGNINYTVDGSSKTIIAGVPVLVTFYSGPLNQRSTNESLWTYETTRYMEWSSYMTSLNVTTDRAQAFALRVRPLNTYDLNASNNYVKIDSVTSIFPNASGDGCTATIMAFLN